MAAQLKKKEGKRQNPSNKEKPSRPLGPLRKKFKKASKEEEPSNVTSSTPPMVSSAVLDDEGALDFPRGGGKILSRRELSEAHGEAKREFEADAKVGKKRLKDKGRKGRRMGVMGDDEIASLFGDGVTGKIPRFTNRITMKNVVANMRLWGVVVEVNPKDLVVSLPGGLRGFVRPEDACDLIPPKKLKNLENELLSSMFHVGQLVPCIILQVEEDKIEGKASKRILLSLRLSLLHKGLSLDLLQDGMALYAVVKSIEDHGYILNFGSSFSGFLPKNQEDGVEINLKVWQLVNCVVNRIDRGRSFVYMSADADLASKGIVKDLKGFSIDSFVPGMMVNARLHAILENGLMLSFLSYFTGTVDLFNLEKSLPTAAWKDAYHQNQKFNARILFVDPVSRAIGLTLNPHLICNTVPPCSVKAGDVFDNSRIVRIDREIGLLVEVPSSPEVTPTYISRLDAADEEVQRLEKVFKEDVHVRVRITGVRLLEGLGIGTLKALAFEGSIFVHEDVKPGMLAKAKVIAVESHGAIVQFPSGVKALCPVPHMSEFEIAKPSKKFKVGADLLFRILGCKSKRITVTYKKTLVKSKLKVLASYVDAVEGMITHGWISKIEKHGCFVKFYNGLHAFAHRSELGLEPGMEATAIYHVGQVIKCRIVSSIPASRRIIVSFILSSKRAGETDFLQIGSHVSGIVTHLTNDAIVVELNSLQKGFIYNEHLADHLGHISILKSSLKPGYKFDKLLVLDIEGKNIILSAKSSLLSSDQLPSDVKQIHQHSVVHGYICNLIETGCFVRFLGRLTGFSPKSKASDKHLGELSDAFYIGQSVRGYVDNVNIETNRISLSLKQSSCSSTDASFIEDYFLMEEKIAGLQCSENSAIKQLEVNQLVEAVVQEKKEYGVVVHLLGYNDVVGFITNYQLDGKSVENGSSVRGLIVDVSVSENLVDISMKSRLVDSFASQNTKRSSSKKKRQREVSHLLGLHETKNAIVELVKENYLVLSLPDCNNAIGYASIIDYNTQKFPRVNFVEGQSVLVTIEALPMSTQCGRLLLLLKSNTGMSHPASVKKAKKNSAYVVGAIIQAEITDICKTEFFVKFGGGCIGRVHITEVLDVFNLENPFVHFKVGQVITARIVAKGGKGYQWDLTVKPSSISDMEKAAKDLDDDFSFVLGQNIKGYVTKVGTDWVSLTVSRSVSAQLFILDSASDPDELEHFCTRYSIGMPVIGQVVGIDKEKRLLRIALQGPIVDSGKSLSTNMVTGSISEERGSSNIIVPMHIHQHNVIGGRIKKILPGIGGVMVQIGPHLYGRVHYTELVDQWCVNPLSNYLEGQFVKCRILEVAHSPEGFLHVDLSLRAASGDTQNANFLEHSDMDIINGRYEKVEQLHAGMTVQGYVKNVTAKGCFIMLSRKVDARILLSNLSDGFVENLEIDFPVGKLVRGRVVSVEPLSGRVDVTLKSEKSNDASKTEISDFSNLHVGDIVSGKIKRIESYGLFVVIDNTNVVGLCHISEISEDRIENIASKFRAGEKVKAKILKMDLEKRRVSLGMKDMLIIDDSNSPTHNTTVDNLMQEKDYSYVDLPSSAPDPLQDLFHDLHGKQLGNLDAPVPSLDVKLDDDSGSDVDVDATMQNDDAVAIDAAPENVKRHLKKKEKERRELEISASEERRLQNDIPRTADEFEKLVRRSPNSSFVWIKYMAFLLSLAEVQEARSVAERALRTISFREENEKLNVWVAYLNLENEYGFPREEAVKKLLERALQFCDPKKLHVALLGIYQRTEQDKLADDILQKMTKKFKHSCKVWLHYAENLLKKNKDEIQNVVNRALLSLPHKKHIKFISQAAILEFRFGLPDRGRKLFEEILKEYPKRTDIWSIYIDQVIRLGDPDVTRALFERATCLSLAPKKLKFLFKKYLEYEKSVGDEDRMEYVKRKALEFVESCKAS